jgi:hypothetical protein
VASIVAYVSLYCVSLLNFLVLYVSLGSAPLRVEIRDSEVWLVSGEDAKQLTSDGKAKLQAELSPSNDRIVYYEQCPESEHCIPSVIILNIEGQHVASFQPKSQGVPEDPCMSILSLSWTGENAISVVCHINPSVNEYIETDLITSQTNRDLLGYDFAQSPDGKKIAHAGWNPHFAPPDLKSDYLVVDSTIVYPLPKNTFPIEQIGFSRPPAVVRRRGLTSFGIHEFVSQISWSSDSQRIALIECTYDWTEDRQSLQAGVGTESRRRCSVLAASPAGKVELFGLSEFSLADLYQSHLEWTKTRELTLNVKGAMKTFEIQ